MIYVLFSGGVDSLACLLWAIEEYGKDAVRAIYFDLGQCYADKEIRAATDIADELGVQLEVREDLKYLLKEDRSNAHIPLRNIFLIMAVAAIPSADGVVFGMLKGECPEDKNPKFVRRMRQLLDSQFVPNVYGAGRAFRIHTPIAGMTKAKVIRAIYRQRPGLMRHTVGCHEPQEQPCGKCWACINRWAAFGALGMVGEDCPDRYAKDPADALRNSHMAVWERGWRRVPSLLTLLRKLPWVLMTLKASRAWKRKSYTA